MTPTASTRHVRSAHAAPLRPLYQPMTLAESLLLLCTLIFAATTCLCIVFLAQQSDANKRRHAVEQEQFVCLDAQGKIMTHEDLSFAECVPVVFRRADEDNVN